MIFRPLSLFALSALTVALPSLSQSLSQSSSVLLAEQRTTIEYSVSSGAAVVIFEAEADVPIEHLAVSDGRRRAVVDVGTRSASGVESFRVESAPTDLVTLLARFPAGVFTFDARFTRGGSGRGTAQLSHAVPRPAVVLWPKPGAFDVPTDVEIRWEPSQDARAFEIVLEQGDSDGLRVVLPPGVHSFRVPAGVLAPRTASHVEVGVVGASGNRTLLEVPFVTR